MRMRNTSMLRASGLAVAGAAVVLGASAAQAAVIQVTGDPADHRVEHDYTNGTNDANLQMNNAGRVAGYLFKNTNPNRGRKSGFNGIFVFELPALPTGQTLSSADFSFAWNFANSPSYNVDLYGVAIQNTNNPNFVSYFDGALDASNTLIQDNLLTPNSDDSGSGRNGSTNASGDAALAAYLNTFYGATPYSGSGEYLFLRTNQDTGPPALGSPQNDGYGVKFNETTDGASSQPLLTLTTVVPEPATGGLALLGLGGLAMLGRRRRRGRA